MKLVLLHDARALDGRPDERDALVQAECLGEALRAAGHETVCLGMALDLHEARAALLEHAPDVVFNLVESIGGEGRLIHLAPALLDSMALPYTGAPTEAMFISSHKVWTKRLLVAMGIPTPAWFEASGRPGSIKAARGRFIVKSVWEDASLGLDDDSVVDVDSVEELDARLLDRRHSLGGEAFAEAWIEGREFNLAILETERGPTVLPVAEMCFEDFPAGKPRLVGYRAKWDEDSFEYSHTVRRFELARADAVLVEQMQSIARECFTGLGLRGYARVDFRVDATGSPWVLEVNPNPCLSPDAGFMAAAERQELNLQMVALSIVGTALASNERQFASGNARGRGF